MRKLRIWEASALLALSASPLMGTWAQGRQTDLSDRLIRLHVVAASDDEGEQALKLRVRDAVLAYLRPTLAELDDADRAAMVLEDRLEEIAGVAGGASEGRPVRVSLEREWFPLRQYEGFALPAGEYRSLRIVLGEGKGHNWWCVVFPPLCEQVIAPEQARTVMGGDNFSLIAEEEGYELRFRLLELWGELRQSFRSSP